MVKLSYIETELEETPIELPASKSISNRALIIHALATDKPELINLSEANDTRVLQKVLNPDTHEKNVGIAGTAARFLCAYLATQNYAFRVDGDQRMRERPMKDLLDALEKLGASIHYLDKQGFLPIEINGAQTHGGSIDIPASVSSQFISALMLIAPTLKGGLVITLQGEVTSEPYILMTQSILEYFGIEVKYTSNQIEIPEQAFHKKALNIESDWSSASYFYSALSLMDEGSILLKNLNFESWQGDEICADIYYRLGIRSTKQGYDVLLEKTGQVIHYLEYDFSDCPDLAQTVICTCVGLGLSGEFRGLHTLRSKETDRIAAIQTELIKLNWELKESKDGVFQLQPCKEKNELNLNIATYNDHRMAMAFAPLAIVYGQLIINNPEVVQKSFPHFWLELEKIGIS